MAIGTEPPAVEPRADASSSPEPPFPHRRRAVLVAGVFVLLWSVACNALLDASMVAPSPTRAVALIFGEPPLVFVLSSALMLVALLTLIALTGRVLVGSALLLAAVVVVGYANHAKLSLRQEPIYPSDMTFLGQI